MVALHISMWLLLIHPSLIHPTPNSLCFMQPDTSLHQSHHCPCCCNLHVDRQVAACVCLRFKWPRSQLSHDACFPLTTHPPWQLLLAAA